MFDEFGEEVDLRDEQRIELLASVIARGFILQNLTVPSDDDLRRRAEHWSHRVAMIPTDCIERCFEAAISDLSVIINSRFGLLPVDLLDAWRNLSSVPPRGNHLRLM